MHYLQYHSRYQPHMVDRFLYPCSVEIDQQHNFHISYLLLVPLFRYYISYKCRCLEPLFFLLGVVDARLVLDFVVELEFRIVLDVPLPRDERDERRSATGCGSSSPSDTSTSSITGHISCNLMVMNYLLYHSMYQHHMVYRCLDRYLVDINRQCNLYCRAVGAVNRYLYNKIIKK